MSKPKWWSEVEAEIDHQLEGFTDKLRQKLSVDPLRILRRKNPFLFRVRCGNDPQEFARMVVDAYLSSSEETIFGNIIEEIAIAICQHAKGGRKSAAEGIDLEYDDNHQRMILQIKSGPNWGNASQRKKLVDNFNSAQKRLGASGVATQGVEGIAYGPTEEIDLGSHIRQTGGAFWKAISGHDEIEQMVMDAMGKHAANGLNKPREEAAKKLVSVLREKGAIKDSKLEWSVLLRLVMDDTGK